MAKSISMKSSVRGVMKAAGVLLGLLLFSTCDVFNVGLGNKVDIRPPEIAITSPSNNDYRGADFTVAGTVADDLGLSSVTVVVDSVSYEASVSGGSWSVALPIAGISEGRKTISAVAKDDAGKERTAAIDVNIDYSAPTVMVTSPTTFGILAGDVPQNTTYIDIKGSTYDPSPIDSIVVRLLDASKSEIATAVAKGTDTWSVRFVLKDDLLGAADDGHAFYYDVVATDKPGNVSEVYYHSYDIYNLVPPGVLFPAMDEIGTLDQAGTGVSPSGLDAAALIAKRLGQASVRADIQYGNFKYVNEAVPIIAFSNLDAAKPQNENLLGLNAVATGNIIPPVNSGAIDPTTLSVEIFSSSAPAVPLTTITTSNANKDNLALVSLGDSLSFTIAMKNGAIDLPQGGYKMVVTAKAQGSEFNSQAVMFFIDSGAPTLNETTVGIGMPFRKAPFTLGAVALDGLYSSLGLQDLKIYQSKDGAPETLVQTIDLGGAVSSSWDSDPLPSPAADGSYNYTLVLTTISGKTVNAYRAVTYDSVAPVVEITSFDSYATGSKVNGTVSFNSIASDANGIEGTKYFVTTSATAPAYSASVGSPASVLQVLAAQSIDTTSLTDLGTYYLWVVARDKAGNEAANTTPLSFQVDQSTDRPVVTLTSLSSSITAEGSVDKDHNLLQAGGKLSGSVTDDDGVDSATLEIDLDRDGSFEGGAESVPLTLSGFGKTKSFEYAASGLPENSYSFRIDAQDTNATPIHNAAMTPVWFAYDVSDPTVVFNPNAMDASPVGPYRKADFTAQGTVQDASGITKVEFSLDGGATWTDLGVTEVTSAAKAWTHLVNAAANNGAKSLVTRATDRYGRTSQNAEVPVVIDTAAPTASIVPFGAGHYADTTLALSGTAADPLAGLSKVEYSLASAAGPWSSLTGTASWFKNDIETQALPEGTATVWVKATDNAGNESSVYSQTFLVDHFAPTLTVDAAFDGAVYKNAQFTVSGTVADTNLGATPIGVTATKDGVAHALTNAVAYDAGPDPDTWSLLVNIGGTGNYELTITATDGVGRKTVEKRSVTVDTTPPLVSITSFDSYATGSKVNATVSFNSIASDANGIEGTKYFVTTSATAPAYSASVGSPASVLQVLAGQSIDTTSLPDLGTYYLWVVARDKAGNEAANATALSFQVDQSTDLPVVTLTSVDPGVVTQGSAGTNLLVAGGRIEGSVVDDDGLGFATISVWNASSALVVDTAALSLSGSGRSKSFSYDVSALADGAYYFTVDVLDTNTTPVHNEPMTAVWFAYDTAVPTVVLSPIAGDYRKADFTAGGTVLDANGIQKLEFSYDGGATWTDLSLTAASGENKAWSHLVVAAAHEGAKILVARATDAFGRQGLSASKTLTIDATAPSAAIADFAAGYYADALLAASGNAFDATSGVLKVEYSLDSAAGPWNSLTGTNLWLKSDMDSSALPEGAATIWVKSTDNAGNESVVANKTFIVDHGNPDLTVDAAYDGIVYRNAQFTISGSVTDGNLGASPITVTAKKDGAAHALTGAFSYGAGAWSQVVNVSGSGVYLITITAKDSLNRTSAATRSVTVDTTAPSVAVTSVSPLLAGNVVNGKVTLSATASDSSGLAGVKYFVRSAAGVPAYADGDSVAMDAPYSETIDTTSPLLSGTYYLYVVARDNAGNEAAHLATVLVNQSSDAPAGTIESPVAGDPIGADKKVRGTFIDDDGVASGGSILYVKKSTEGSYTAFPISASSSATQLVAWSVDLSAYLALPANGDGTYDIYLRVTDDATKKAGLAAAFSETVPRQFTWDNSPPTVSTSIGAAPAKAAYRAGDAVTLSWTASDASGIATQDYALEGAAAGDFSSLTAATPDYSVVFTVPAGMSSGNKTFTLVATDSTGRSTTRTTSLLVDNDVPSVEAAITLEPAFVGFTPNGAFAIKGTASDNRGLSKVQVRLTGSGGGANLDWTDAVLVNGTWSFPIADSATYVPASGNLGIEAKSIDFAGNESAIQSFSKAVDQAADKPTVAVISPVGGTTYGSTVQISGTAADDDNLADLDDNSAIDADALAIEYWDNALPGTKFTVNPTISGSGKSATWNYSLTGLAGGNYTVHVRAKDDAGTLGDWSADATFTVDTGVPTLVVSTALAAFVNNGSLVLTGTAEDSGGLKYVRARVNGGSWILATAAGMTDVNADGFWDSLATGMVNWTINLNLGSDGLKTIEIAAADNNDLVSTAQRSATLDATAPTGAFDAQFRDDPSGTFLATTILNKLVRITGTVTELNLRDTDPIEISIEDGVNDAWTPVAGTFVWSHAWSTASLADGDYTLRLRVTDKAGNFTDSIVKVVTTKQSADVPAITQAFVDAPSSAEAGSNVLGAVLKISGTISDDDGFMAGAVSVLLDGATTLTPTSPSGTTSPWEYTWASLAEGEHYLAITVTDRNGASASIGPTYFIVDSQNPALSLTTPAAGAKVKEGNLVIAGTATDGGGFGANPLSITLRHSDTGSPLHNQVLNPAVAGGVFSQSVPIDAASRDGTLYMDLVLADRAGKQASITRAVTIDTTAPSLGLNYPSHAAYINGLVSVTGTADDLSGLADVTLQILDPATKLPVAGLTRGTTLSAWDFSLNAETYASATYGVDMNADGKLWKVFFRLAATDNSGNVTEYKVGDPLDWPYFFIDTDGDKPTISVTQPKNGDKIGGFVNMFGTATDDDGAVMQVEVQIDFNGDGDFLDSRDLDNSDGDSNPLTGIQSGVDTDILGTIVKIGDAAHKWEDESAWYVVSVSNNAWTEELNSANELYASNTGGTGNITIRARSRDMFGLASEISSRTITLDQNFPRIENATPLDQSYQSGVFDLFAEFGDNVDLALGPVAQIRINVNKTGYQTLSEGSNTGAGHPYALVADLAEPQNGYDLTFPIDTNSYFNNSSGILYVDLYVRDLANNVNQKTLTYYVDNQDPSSSWSDSSTRPDGSSLRNGMITVNGAAKTYVEANYGDSGSVSGIARIEAYVVQGGQVRNLKASGVWAGTPATESAAIETYSLVDNTWTAGTNPAAPIVTHAALGSDYVIKVDKATEMSDLILGTDTDADGYHEYLGIYEGKARWRAYFDSQYLPDGLADLHYVVYDLAGNYVHRMRQVFFANNGPRFDQVRAGSDLNSNGSVANPDLVAKTGLSLSGADRPSAASFVDTSLAGNALVAVGQRITVNGASRGAISAWDSASGLIAWDGAALATGTPVTSYSITEIEEMKDYYNLETALDRSDYLRAKNGKLRLAVFASDPTGSNQGVKKVFVDVYDASGTVKFGSPQAAGYDPVDGDMDVTLSPTPGSAPWNTAYSGGLADFNLKVTIRDNDDINVSRWVKARIVDPADSTKPVVTLSPLAQADQLSSVGHLELKGDSSASAWTAIAAAYGDDDPKASGTIVVRGTVFDENRVTEVSGAAEGIPQTLLASWSGGALAAATGAFEITGQTLGETGHTVSFAYSWNTADVTGVAGLDKSLAFGARDGAAAPNAADPKSQRVDVVPYIKAIARDPLNYNTSRSRLGSFSLRQGEPVTVTGFNIFNTTADTVSFPGAATTLSAGSTPESFTVTLPAAATSGPVTVTVSGIVSVNNLNDNTKAWNTEVDPANAASALWTDDRKVHVWRSDDLQAGSNRGYFTGSVDPEYPAMTIDPTGTLYGSWSNYATANVYYGVNNGAATAFFNSYDPSEHTDIDYGARQAVVWNANTYGNGTWSSTGAGGVYVYDENANAALDCNWGNAYESELLYHDQRLMQFVNQRIATNGPDIHISYYDTDTKALKYWHATTGANPAYAQTWINLDGGADEHDGTATSMTATKPVASVTYVSAAAPHQSVSNRSGTVASVSSGLVNTYVTSGTTIATTTQPRNIAADASGVLTGFLVAVNDPVTSGVTPVANMQLDTTVQAVDVAVGDYVGVGDRLMTMANGTQVTAGTAGYVGFIAAVGSSARHNTTTVATIMSVRVQSIQKGVGSPVTLGDTILTLSDSTTVTAAADGVLAFVAPLGTAVGAGTLMATSYSGARVVSGNRSAAAGEFSAIDVMPTSGYPVIAYYDITNQTVKLARASTVNPTGAQWILQTVMSSVSDPNFKYSGKYISMRIDSAGYVHLAFYRNSTGDLVYMKSTNNPTDGSAYVFGKSVIVDSVGSVGIWADVSLDGTNPVLSYLDSSMVNTFDGVKVAYYDPTLETLSGDTAGQPDTIDGWETMNAALGYEVESVRTSVEVDTGANFWHAAVGYGSSDYFRIGYYVK